MRRTPPPVWFELLAAIGLALLWRALAPEPAAAPAVHLAFWGWAVTLIQLVWAGVQAVGDASLYVLTLFVNSLATIVRGITNGLVAFGKILQRGLLEAWQFFRKTYDTILKPAWLKVFRLVDWAKRTLDDFFRPIFKFLRHLRAELLKFYDKWVRPILDTIGVARKVLAVFRALGLDWAKKLDAKLASLEEQIDRPFRLLLAKINEVMNFVNRIATANGLFQRLALVQSITRDFTVIGEEYGRWHKKAATPAELAAQAARVYPELDPHRIGVEIGNFYRDDSGEYAALINELIPEWRRAAGLST